jgi:hypothetical protein
MRARSMFLWLGVALTVLLPLAQPAQAQEDDHSEDTPTVPVTGPEGSVGIGDGIFLTGATITPVDGGEPRTLDAYQAAAFTQGFLAQAFFGPADIKQDPPADLPVYRVELAGDYAGDVGVMTVHYTDDGTKAYVAFPGLEVTPTPVDPPPEPSNWFVATKLTMDAFNGEGVVQESAGTQTTTTTTEQGSDDAAASEDDDDSPVVWIVAGVVAAAVLIGGGLWLRGRRQTEGPGEPDGTDEPVDAGVAP